MYYTLHCDYSFKKINNINNLLYKYTSYFNYTIKLIDILFYIYKQIMAIVTNSFLGFGR